MKYISTRDTRDSKRKISASEAIKKGIAPDGGLFVPEHIPEIKIDDDFKKLNYRELAFKILSLYLTDYSQQELKSLIGKAYNSQKFSSPSITPLIPLHSRIYFLELWHGPTLAFKDMGLQMLPHLLTSALRKLNESREVVILTATSGDTGKAALSGFQDVPQTRIVVFYPQEGISRIQKKQMTTQEGNNVCVTAVKGDFDDAQNGVKEIFNESEYNECIEKNGFFFSSANSINWGRLVPQIIYYFSAYSELLKNGGIEKNEKLNIVVPTGNFGNILAAYYALKMGLPVHKLICASNANKVLTDFFNTGCYSRSEYLLKNTISPSMDILLSSNLERLLFEAKDGDARWIKAWMHQLDHKGEYTVDKGSKKYIDQIFWADYATDGETLQGIRETFEAYGYLIDPHTAVAKTVHNKYLTQTGDKRKTIIASTASPFKFPAAVLRALDEEESAELRADKKLLKRLESLSGCQVPEQLAVLSEKEERFTSLCSPEKMKEKVSLFLGLEKKN